MSQLGGLHNPVEELIWASLSRQLSLGLLSQAFCVNKHSMELFAVVGDGRKAVRKINNVIYLKPLGKIEINLFASFFIYSVCRTIVAMGTRTHGTTISITNRPETDWPKMPTASVRLSGSCSFLAHI